MGNTQGCCVPFWINPGSSTLQNNSLQTIEEEKQDILGTDRKVRMNSWMTVSPTHGHMVGWSAKTYIHQLSEDTGCHLEDSPRAITDRDRWQERKSRQSRLSVHLDFSSYKLLIALLVYIQSSSILFRNTFFLTRYNKIIPIKIYSMGKMMTWNC